MDLNTEKTNNKTKEENVTRSEFLKKAGKFALITGPVLAVLLTSTRAKADSTEAGGGSPQP